MDGENKGIPYEQMGWFGGFYHPYFWVDIHISYPYFMIFPSFTS